MESTIFTFADKFGIKFEYIIGWIVEDGIITLWLTTGKEVKISNQKHPEIYRAILPILSVSRMG